MKSNLDILDDNGIFHKHNGIPGHDIHKTRHLPSIDSGSLDSINLPPGFKIDIFADELDGSPVASKSHGLDFYDLLYFDPGTGGIVKEVGMVMVMAIFFFGVAVSRFRFE